MSEPTSAVIGLDHGSRRIGVAVGTQKVEAIVAAARSRLVNVLVTDVITASALGVNAPLGGSSASAEKAGDVRD